MSAYRKLLGVWDKLQRCCKTVQSFYKESPMVVGIVLAILLVLILLGLLINKCFTLFLGARGAVIMDLGVIWLLVRFIVRAMVFPGSLRLVQRNTEATYRVEMSRQYIEHLKQLHIFVRHVAKQSGGVPRGLSAEGVLRGFAVVECISKSFRLQEQDEVRLSGEQAQLFALCSGLESWLSEAKIQRRTEGQGDEYPLAVDAIDASESRAMVEWLRELTRSARNSNLRFSQLSTLVGVELVDAGADSKRQIEHIDELITLLNDLRAGKASWWQSTMRFLRVPTIGSLNQLRTELQMRYSSVQCWVPTSRGTRLDGMFIPCDPEAMGAGASDSADLDAEDAPLNSLGAGSSSASFSGPTLVWCNPNAGYYETMVYQSNILNFYLSRGCNIFLFNYSGFGRSGGSPTTSKVADDAHSVVEFLKSKGINQMGIHGRSIGGIAACHLAKRHPDVVKFMVTDRTFSTLGSTAKYTYGAWAEMGLALGAMWATNTANFLGATCYKVMVCDPKDGIIPDISSLRAAAALNAISSMAPEERLDMESERLLKLSDAWRFFTALLTTCEEEELYSFTEIHEDVDARDRGGAASRSARQPTISSPANAAAGDVQVKVGDSTSEQSPTLKKNATASATDRIDERWLRENLNIVQSAIGPHINQIRVALDMVIEHLDAGGLSLHDVLGDVPGDPCYVLRSWLANLQVWGSIGDPRDGAGLLHSSNYSPTVDTSCQDGINDVEIAGFLRKTDQAANSARQVTPKRLKELDGTLSPSTVANYHRQLARTQVVLVRRELRRRLTNLHQAFRNGSQNGGDAAQSVEADQLRSAVLEHLGEVEAFITTLGRFFKSVDLMQPFSKQVGKDSNKVLRVESAPLSDSSDEKAVNVSGEPAEVMIPRPVIDHSIYGHVVHTDCGHNGVLDDSEFRLIGLHMRVARFGRVHAGDEP